LGVGWTWKESSAVHAIRRERCRRGKLSYDGSMVHDSRKHGEGDRRFERDRTIGVVLVGGASLRMGTPKERVEIAAGRTMLACVESALEPVVSAVLHSGEGDTRLNRPRIADSAPGAGPLAAIADCLRFIAEGMVHADAQRALVCPCDMPWLTATLLHRLRDEGDAPIAVLRSSERMHLLPMRVSVSALPRLEALLAGGERSLKSLVRCGSFDAVAVADDERPLLRNVNTPEDLERAESSDRT